MTARKSNHPTLLYLLLFLLLGTFLLIFYLQKQHESRGQAEGGSSISFSPTSTSKSPLTYTTGSTFTVDVMLDPGPQAVTFVKLLLNYDPLVLSLADGTNSVQINNTAFPSIAEGPVVSSGRIGVSMMIGTDITKSITSPTRMATLTFKSLNATKRTPTSITVDPATLVLSSSELAEVSENVLSTTSPAYIKVSAPKRSRK
jgi:hypothetical protein